MRSQVWWYLSRSSGLVAATLLTLSLVVGILLATRVLRPADRPAWLLAVHRWISGLAVVGTAIHLAALVADSYAHFGAAELLVPMASTWKPGAVTFGVVGFYLMVLVQGTSLMMKKLPKRLWRGIHLTSYAMVWLVAIHAGLAGTDASNIVYRVVAVALTVLAVTAVVLRVVTGRFADQRAAKARSGQDRPGGPGRQSDAPRQSAPQPPAGDEPTSTLEPVSFVAEPIGSTPSRRTLPPPLPTDPSTAQISDRPIDPLLARAWVRAQPGGDGRASD